MGSTHGREVAGEAQPQRAGTSHSLSPGTASPTARAGQGRAGPGEPRRGPRARGIARPGKDQTHRWGTRQAAAEGSEGAGPERSPQGQPACHFLICWADFLSPEGEGAGRVGGAC